MASGATAELTRVASLAAAAAVLRVRGQIVVLVRVAVAVFVEPVAGDFFGQSCGRAAGERAVGTRRRAVAARAELREIHAEGVQPGYIVDEEVAVVIHARVLTGFRTRGDSALARAKDAAATMLHASSAAPKAYREPRPRVAGLALVAAARATVIDLPVAVLVRGLRAAALLGARLNEVRACLELAVFARLRACFAHA
jgi:hypothetical protein